MILEILAGMAGIIIIGIVSTKYVRKEKEGKKERLGDFRICYTKGKNPQNSVYLPWFYRSYETEEELEIEQDNLCKIAQELSLQDQGMEGISMIEESTGEEWFWIRIENNNRNKK